MNDINVTRTGNRNWEYNVMRYVYCSGHWREKQRCLCSGEMAPSLCISVSVTELVPAALYSESLFLLVSLPRSRQAPGSSHKDTGVERPHTATPTGQIHDLSPTTATRILEYH